LLSLSLSLSFVVCGCSGWSNIARNWLALLPLNVILKVNFLNDSDVVAFYLLMQPCTTVLAVKQKAVCFTGVMLFIYFIVEAYISIITGRIFVILVSFNQNSLRILGFIQTSDRCAS